MKGSLRLKLTGWLSIIMMVAAGFVFTLPAQAITKIPNPDPRPGSFGLEATKTQEPPKIGARISLPTNGSSFTNSPITVQGICPDGLLVEIYNNNVLVGAVNCEDGRFRVQVGLFIGKNDLHALVFDNTDQPGPKSNTISVTYSNTNFSAFGELVTLTSQYGRRAASIGQTLSWPIQLTGGSGPYAINVDWADGSSSDLISRTTSGQFNINHIYEKAGVYTVNIRATDRNGVTSFLQVIAIANGQVKADGTEEDVICREATKTRVIWMPAVLAFLMLPIAYYLGKRSQLVVLRKELLASRDQYADKND